MGQQDEKSKKYDQVDLSFPMHRNPRPIEEDPQYGLLNLPGKPPVSLFGLVDIYKPKAPQGRKPELTEAQVKELRLSSESHKDAASRLGVPYYAVHNARVGMSWGALMDPPPWPKRKRNKKEL